MTEAPFSLLVTGNSSGLGRGLTEAALQRGWRVYGCSRRGCDLPGDLHDLRCDLADLDSIPVMLDTLLGDAGRLDLVILNAGVLGRIRKITGTSVDELRSLMEINVWANKVILDWLCAWGCPVEQILMISSGASVLGNKGWGGYALSKAALNMLGRLYAHELPHTHVCALAPGLIDTSMMDYLCGEADAQAFPALQRIREARGTDAMPEPREAAERVLSVLAAVRELPSGSYADIRRILDPEAYARLMGAGPPGGRAS